MLSKRALSPLRPGLIPARHRRIGLGTGVLAMQVRTPPLLAMAAACLQALAPDREVLLGVGVTVATTCVVLLPPKVVRKLCTKRSTSSGAT